MADFATLIPSDQGVRGLSVARSLNLGTTGANPKTAPGAVYGWHIRNANAAVAFVRLYNLATAPASTDTPLATIAVPAGGAISESFPHGIRFTAGIGWRATLAAADADTTAPTAGDVVANLFYA